MAEQQEVELEAAPFESLLLGTIDAALAAQNAVVALESFGLDSVYIGAIRNDIEGGAKELGLPPQVYPVFGLCIGYRYGADGALLDSVNLVDVILTAETMFKAGRGVSWGG